MRNRAGNWFQTYTGVMFWPLDPRPEEIELEDIAHSLSMQCRFNGHMKSFYSVAQHSVEVSRIVPAEHALWGLLHDAAEAYIGDMVRPLKLHMPTFRAIEDQIMIAICDRFGLPRAEPPEVKIADNVLLMTERRDFLGTPPAPWTPRAEPLALVLKAQTPIYAKASFLGRFDQLQKGYPS